MERSPHTPLAIFQELLETWEKGPVRKETDVDAFLADQMAARMSSVTPDEALAMTAEFLETLDGIDASWRDLRASADRGESRTEWLSRSLSDALGSRPDRDDLIGHMKQSLSNATGEVLGIEPEARIAPLPTGTFDGLAKGLISQNLGQEIERMTLAGIVLRAAGIGPSLDESVPEHSGSRMARDFIESPLGDKSERPVRGFATAAALLSSRLDPSSEFASWPPSTIAGAVDHGLFGAKVAYTVDRGETPLDAAVGLVIDRVTAIIANAVEHACTKHAPSVGATIGAAIGRMFGPKGIEVGTQLGRKAGEIAGRPVGAALAEGVRTLGQFVKPAVQAFVRAGSRFLNECGKKVRQFLFG